MQKFATIVITLLIPITYAQQAPHNRRSDPPGTDAARSLMRRVDAVRFESTPLAQVFDWVAEFTGAPVVVRWSALEEAGLRRDTPITLAVEDRRLWRVLWAVMNSTPLVLQDRLAYEAGRDGFLFSTHSDLSRNLITVVYDVEAWLQPDVDFISPDIFQSPIQFNFVDFSARLPGPDCFVEPQPRLPDDGRIPPGATPINGGKNGYEIRHHTKVKRVRTRPSEGSEQPKGEEYDPFAADAKIAPEMRDLLELILNTIEPQSWELNGAGGRATIAPLNNRAIVIRNSLYVHQMIGGLVRDTDLLEKARTTPLAGPPAPKPSLSAAEKESK